MLPKLQKRRKSICECAETFEQNEKTETSLGTLAALKAAMQKCHCVENLLS